MEVQLLYNIVLVSAVEQSDSIIVIHTYLYICIYSYTHIHIYLFILFHFGLSQDIEYTSLFSKTLFYASQICYLKFITSGVPILEQQKRIRLGTRRLRLRSLALLGGLRIWCCVSYGVGHRHGSDLALLWLWSRLVTTALIRHTPGLGTSICPGWGPGKIKDKNLSLF